MVSAEGSLTIYLHGATNLLQTPIRVHVASATRGYTGTALPAAAADAAGGLVISDAGGLDVDTYLGRITGNVALASSLPSNFSLLGINGSGHLSRVTLTDTTTTNTDMVDVSSLATATSIAALNDFDPTTQTVTTDSASRTASQADVSALATAANLATVDTVVDGIKAVTDNLPNSGALTDLATAAALTTVDTVVDAIKVTTDKLDDTLELDGAEYRFTANALEEAPSGGGGGGGSAPTEAEIYTYFTASSREDVFKADVSALATETNATSNKNAVLTRLGTPAGADVSTDIAAVKTDTGNLVARITATLFTGITSVAEWLGALAGKQAANSTARTEIRATGAGSGTFDETADSLEAIREKTDTITGGASQDIDVEFTTITSDD